MYCSEFHTRLDVLLDERQDAAADGQLATHAEDCADCRKHLAAQRAVLAGLSLMNTPALSASFARRVVARAAPALMTRARGSSRARTRTILAALASAAVMLIAVTVLWFVRQWQPAGSENAPFGIRGGLGGFSLLTPPAPSGAPQPRNSSQLTSADLLLQAPRWPGRLRDYRVAVDNLALTLPQATQRLEELERLAPGFRPLRASLSMLWDMLCVALPANSAESQLPPREATSTLAQSFLGLA